MKKITLKQNKKDQFEAHTAALIAAMTASIPVMAIAFLRGNNPRALEIVCLIRQAFVDHCGEYCDGEHALSKNEMVEIANFSDMEIS